jgi:signal peptidase I
VSPEATGGDDRPVRTWSEPLREQPSSSAGEQARDGVPAGRHEAVAEDAAAEETGGEATERRRSHNRALAEWVVAIALAVVAAFLIKTFLVQAFVIPSGSMEHTLEINDRVLVSKFAYRISDIHRGDVIVFKNPKRLPGEPAQLIKRVAATAGDVIEAVDGKVVVNGQVRDEPYLAPATPTRDLPRQTVPPDHVFVLGDNRTNSKDSRFIGPIDTSTVTGKAFFRIWPLGRLGGL